MFYSWRFDPISDLSEPSLTSLLSYSVLVTLLTQDDEAPAIFNAGLNRQKNKLTRDQVIELAELAIKQNHVEELDMLSGAIKIIINEMSQNVIYTQMKKLKNMGLMVYTHRHQLS